MSRNTKFLAGAAVLAVELRDTGVLGRREMLVRLVAICGSVGAATAFLASCSDDSAGEYP